MSASQGGIVFRRYRTVPGAVEGGQESDRAFGDSTRPCTGQVCVSINTWEVPCGKWRLLGAAKHTQHKVCASYDQTCAHPFSCSGVCGGGEPARLASVPTPLRDAPSSPPLPCLLPQVFVEEENLPGRYRLIKESPARPQGEAEGVVV